MILALLLIVSFAVVGWGQPHVSAFLSFLASTIGFALFWVALFRVKGKKRRFLYGALWFFAVQLVQLSWFASPTYQGIYIYFVYLGLSLWLGVQFGLLSCFLPKKGPICLPRILGIAAFWTLMEWGRLFVLCGFAWNPVGLSMTASSIGTQFAAVVGIYGLSFLVMLLNLLGVNLLIKRTKKTVVLYSAFLIFPYLFGVAHIYYHDTQRRQKESYRVALIQTALLPDQKERFLGKEERHIHPLLQWRQIFSGLKAHHSKDLDLIILPEYALPFSAYSAVYPLAEIKAMLGNERGDLEPLLKKPFAENRGGKWFVSNAFLMQMLANRYGAEIVSGLGAQEAGKRYNAAFHFIPQEDRALRYDKRILLPLAEYLPFSFLKPLVARYGISDFFSRGSEAKVTKGKQPMSLSICYEECFPYIMREGRQKGAHLFVNVTNDGWYPYSSLSEEHFIHGRVRSIENGVPLLRACNTGVTAGVDSLGRTIARFENSKGEFELERGILYLALDLYTFPTLYTFWGDRFILIVSIGFLSFLIPGKRILLLKNVD